MSIMGTRPEIIKMSPLIPLLDEAFDHRILYTGQHYDYEMSEVFFREFGLRKPDHRIDILAEEVSEASPNKRLCFMFCGVKEGIRLERPDLCIVLGDTDSALVGGLAASALHVPLVHIEAGLRSLDMAMPEERNRIVLDNLSTLLFAPSTLASKNLRCEGIDRNVHVVGNTIVDVCLRFRSEASKLKSYEWYGLAPKEYMVVTIHRESNTRGETLCKIFRALMKLREIPMIIPIHPRTRQKLLEAGFWTLITEKSHIKIVKPMGYLEFLSLMLNSRMVLTDSGGIQEEAVTLKVPCLTLRENTERWETVQLRVNRLVGVKPEGILRGVRRSWGDEEWIKKVSNTGNPYGDGHASERIISKLRELSDFTKSLPPIGLSMSEKGRVTLSEVDGGLISNS
jgi:UDP-N-acetylglucosamine 2-epimerase (non-hydrolysing)